MKALRMGHRDIAQIIAIPFARTFPARAQRHTRYERSQDRDKNLFHTSTIQPYSS